MTPSSHWLWFHIAVLVLMAAEFGLHRLFPEPRRKAVYATILWTAASLAFAALLARSYGASGSVQYVAGWAIEEALSVDNLFVFLLLFRLFRIPAIRQPKVLYWGVAGAILMRGAFIAGGLTLLRRFHWVEFVFAAILLIAAIRLLKPDPQDETQAPTPAWLRWLTRLHPVSDRTDRFFSKEVLSIPTLSSRPERSGVERPLYSAAAPVEGPASSSTEPGAPHLAFGDVGSQDIQPTTAHWIPTVLLLALIAVELTDVVFALDSIPAVLSITRNPFLAYTSNIMAVMGLRSLYVLLAAMLRNLRYMHFGLAAILAFASLKMLLADHMTIGPLLSLAIIAILLAITITASLLHKPQTA